MKFFLNYIICTHKKNQVRVERVKRITMIIDLFIKYCFSHEMISDEDIPLLRYCLEKKIYSILISFPLIILGILISDFQTTISFLSAFFYLRSTVNGYHAKTCWGCFWGSTILEIVALKLICPILTSDSAAVSLSVSAIIIWINAPYNHPNMNLSLDEIFACRKSSHYRLIVLIILFTISYTTNHMQTYKGITLGATLTAVLLSFAYINNKEGNICTNVKKKVSQKR